jgi:hypothetical protein
MGITHHGTISGAVCGALKSRFSLLAPDQFKGFSMVASQ